MRVGLGLAGAREGPEGDGKRWGLHPDGGSEPGDLSTGEVGGMGGVAVKCIDNTQNPECEGSVPAGH